MTKEFNFEDEEELNEIEEVEKESIKDFLLYFILMGIIILIVSAFCSTALLYGYLGLTKFVIPVYLLGVLLCSAIALYLYY